MWSARSPGVCSIMQQQKRGEKNQGKLCHKLFFVSLLALGRVLFTFANMVVSCSIQLNIFLQKKDENCRNFTIQASIME